MHTGKESNRWNVLHLSFSAYAWVYVCTQKLPCTDRGVFSVFLKYNYHYTLCGFLLGGKTAISINIRPFNIFANDL